MARVRKAIVGGFAAGVAAVGSSFTFTGAPTKDQAIQIVGTFLVSAAIGGYAVWRIPNTPTQSR